MWGGGGEEGGIVVEERGWWGDGVSKSIILWPWARKRGGGDVIGICYETVIIYTVCFYISSPHPSIPLDTSYTNDFGEYLVFFGFTKMVPN